MEINFIELTGKIARNRVFVFRVVLAFMVAGLLVAFLSPREYTTQITMVSQANMKRNIGGNIAGLAAIAGLNIGGLDNADILSPSVYPQIINSVRYLKEIINAKYHFEGIDHPISLMEYYSNDRYRKHRVLKTIGKYTVGLPGLILHSRRHGKNGPVKGQDSIVVITQAEHELIKEMKKLIRLNNNIKNGYITLQVDMPEPLVSAEIAGKAQELLQIYITDYKIRKAESYLHFIQERFNEAQSDYENKNRQLARYVDENQNTISSVARVREEMLRNEYTLAYTLYSDLARELEQAKISVEENTPILTVLEPAVVPVERSKPQRALILITFMFCGLFFSALSLIILPVMSDVYKNKKWSSFIKP